VFQPQYVVHLAAQAGVRWCSVNPRAYINSNVIGFFNVCEVCKKYNVKHLVYASSSSVYGNAERPSKEEDILDPKSLYAITKSFNEQLASTYDFHTTGLRFFSVYGGEGRPDMFVSKAIRAAESGDVLYVNGDGNQQRDFTYIQDICCGIIMSLDESKAQEKHRIYNIGAEHPHSLNQIVDIIEKLTNKKIKKVYKDVNNLDVQCTWADCSKAKKELGWTPKIDLEEGLKRSIKI
jgi:UDP-glucuronate 4-epimerase